MYFLNFVWINYEFSKYWKYIGVPKINPKLSWVDFTNRSQLGVATVGPLYTMAEGQDAIGFHQWDCKKSRIWPLDPSH